MSEQTPTETHTHGFESWNGELRCWASSGTSCHIKAITSFGDPVELSSDELESVIEALTQILTEIR